MNKGSGHNLQGRIKSFKSTGNSIIIEGFANAATVDRAKELIDPEAFTKSNGLNNFMKNPTILFDHGLDPNVGGLPIGKATEVTPTKQGLFIKAKISQAKDPPISTIRTLIEEGNLRAFSVGFNPEEIEPDEKGVSVIKSAELFEVSVVGLPMNQDSLFQMSAKDGKKAMLKSLSQIKASIADEKGSVSAVKANLALDELSGNELSRKSLIDQIALKANVSEYTVFDYLNGDIDTPSVGRALKEVLKSSKQFEADEDDEEKDEEKKPKEDEEKEKNNKASKTTGKGSGANDHTHTAVFDNENGDGETTTTDGDGPPHKHIIKDFKIEAGGEDSHTHPSLKSMDEEKEDDEEKDDEEEKSDNDSPEKKDFQQCVNEKIPKLIDEGKDQDEAVAIAIDFCRDKNKCNIKPDREMYSQFFKVADDFINKQAQQEGEDGVTTPIDTSAPEEPTTPQLDQQKQTNVLLGSLTNEFKLFRDSLSGMTEELSAAIRQLVIALGTEKSAEGDLPNDDLVTDEDRSEVEKRMSRTKDHLSKLDKRLKELGV